MRKLRGSLFDELFRVHCWRAEDIGDLQRNFLGRPLRMRLPWYQRLRRFDAYAIATVFDVEMALVDAVGEIDSSSVPKDYRLFRVRDATGEIFALWHCDRFKAAQEGQALQETDRVDVSLAVFLTGTIPIIASVRKFRPGSTQRKGRGKHGYLSPILDS